MSPRTLATYFGLTVIEYHGRESKGILLTSGAGIMMACMDAIASFRWCVDLDELRCWPWRIPMFIVALELNTDVDLVGVAGWFSIDDPAPILEGVRKLTRPVVSYFGDRKIGTCATLEQFIQEANHTSTPA